MFSREAYNNLLAWKSNPRHGALLVDGARQVGKTYLVRQFAKNEYEHFAEINFIDSPTAKSIFEGDLSAATLLPLISAFTGVPLVPGKTLVFFDEIQECPNARTAIKFLVDKSEIDYIESGSLLGVSYAQIPSLPVGYEESLRMYPLTFKEFCDALGHYDEAFSLAERAFETRMPLDPVVHDKLSQLFRYYLAVGGMPAVVATFRETRDMTQVLFAQKQILGLYRQDVAKYARNQAHVRAIFDAIPAELSKQNKRFKLSALAKSARTERYENDFIWLADAGVGLPCYNLSGLAMPLGLNRQHSTFKLFLCDTGLLMAMLDDGTQFKILSGDFDVNWGAVLENAFAQILTANGFPVLYYERAKHGEVDFVVQVGGRVIPIEAKSGRTFRAHASLDNVLRVKEWGLDFAYVFCRENVETATFVPEGRDEKCTIAYMPWYFIAFVRPATPTEPYVVEIPE